MSTTKTEAAICISGDIDYDFQAVTGTLLIEPTKIWRCRPEVAIQSPSLNKATWIYELPNLEHVEFSNSLSEILDVAWEHRNEIQKLATKDGLSIAIVITPEGELRDYATVICPSQIRRLAELNAGLNLSFDKLDSQ